MFDERAAVLPLEKSAVPTKLRIRGRRYKALPLVLFCKHKT